MRVKLVRKLANVINDVDITEHHVGDVINVEPHQASLLIAEGWAEAVSAGNTRDAEKQPTHRANPTESVA